MGGVVGGVIGASAAFTLGTVESMEVAAARYLGITKGPQDVRALLPDSAAWWSAAWSAVCSATTAAAPSALWPGVHGGLAGATAGIISAAPVGALIGGVIHARSNLKEHADQ